jgi:hypothetical protein
MSGDELAVIGFLMAYIGAFGLGMVALETIAHWLIDTDMPWVAPAVIGTCMLMIAMDRGISI